MSAQPPASPQPSTVVAPQRIRHENSQSMGLGAGTKDLIMTAGALGIGALGGYYLVDYIVKHNVLDSILSQIPIDIDTGNDTVPTEDDKEANIASIQPYDRTSRVNSGGNTGISAYRGRKVPARLPSIIPEEEEELDAEDAGFNQVFTEDRVYEVV